MRAAETLETFTIQTIKLNESGWLMIVFSVVICRELRAIIKSVKESTFLHRRVLRLELNCMEGGGGVRRHSHQPRNNQKTMKLNKKICMQNFLELNFAAFLMKFTMQSRVNLSSFRRWMKLLLFFPAEMNTPKKIHPRRRFHLIILNNLFIYSRHQNWISSDMKSFFFS